MRRRAEERRRLARARFRRGYRLVRSVIQMILLQKLAQEKLKRFEFNDGFRVYIFIYSI
mgnify:CR=1 FL=1